MLGRPLAMLYGIGILVYTSSQTLRSGQHQQALACRNPVTSISRVNRQAVAQALSHQQPAASPALDQSICLACMSVGKSLQVSVRRCHLVKPVSRPYSLNKSGLVCSKAAAAASLSPKNKLTLRPTQGHSSSAVSCPSLSTTMLLLKACRLDRMLCKLICAATTRPHRGCFPGGYPGNPSCKDERPAQQPATPSTASAAHPHRGQPVQIVCIFPTHRQPHGSLGQPLPVPIASSGRPNCAHNA